MKISINQQVLELAENTTLKAALEEFAAKSPYAIAINGEFIPQSEYASQILSHQDAIEILYPVVGG